jgi:hypothetical protein
MEECNGEDSGDGRDDRKGESDEPKPEPLFSSAVFTESC